MSKIRFTHQIMVPNHRTALEASGGYAEEMKDVKIFSLSQDEYDDLRREGGLFDLFDSAFGTIIDDCEEDRLSGSQVKQAIKMTKSFAESTKSNSTAGLSIILHSLEYADKAGVFWEIVNGAELYE